MPDPASSTPEPKAPAADPPERAHQIICERCGAANLIRVKGCWYCERCHYKFDCYGW